MTYDLIIRGGTLIDGTGRDRYTGDVAVKDGVIVAVGKVDGGADRVFDAAGAIVTPGFTDVHTHYDGQVSWDADLAPSCNHGVTTAVLGNCGVGFAPVRDTDHDQLIALMEGVEDIPGSALAEGLTWNWSTFEQYMDAIDGFPHTIDFCAQVPHDPLRVYVMGERAIAGETATEEDIAEMRRLVRSAVRAGAIGFSTGRSDNHRSADGAATPASEANEAELVGIARALEGLGHGVLQAVSDFDMADGDDRFDGEFDLLERMVAAADGHPLSMSLMQRDQSPNQWERIIARAEKAHAQGTTIRLQVAARAIGVMLGFEATFHPFMGFPTYKTIAHLPLEERVRRMQDPAFRAQVLSEKTDKVSGDGSPIPPLADQLLERIDVVAMRLFELGERPNYEPNMEQSIYAKAYAAGIPTLAAVYDALLQHEGKELLYFPLYNYTLMNLDNVHKMLTHPLSMPGLSDGGAHVGTVCDASFPSFLLSHWGRDRERGRLSVEQIVKMQAHDTSRYIGLRDRGTLAPGQRADLNVIDFDGLRLLRPRLVADLPAGGKRLLQDAEGYEATFVKGVQIVDKGKLTGQRPGRLARVTS
ncbi:MAG: amidohydrolase family protein [Myxococcales bacterium]|nr:amidohydrolase family protein [Myxococcales bacterium]